MYQITPNGIILRFSLHVTILALINKTGLDPGVAKPDNRDKIFAVQLVPEPKNIFDDDKS